MATYGTGDNDGISTAATVSVTNTSTEDANLSLAEIIVISIVASVCAIVFLIAVFVCFYKLRNRCRNSGNKHRRLNQSETCDLYQNSTITRDGLAGVSLETLVNRPLPHLPEINKDSTGVPTVPEDDYVTPITKDAFWLKSREEIQKLPPAPPVFPVHLERFQLEGEGAYTPVIPDDEAPLLSPGPTHEIAHNLQFCESNEESGYMVPRSPAHTSLQQNVTETHHSTQTRKMKRKGSEYQMIAKAVVTSHEAEKQCRNTSNRRSLSESATVNSAAQSETEKSKDTKGQVYRSTCQLYLSPPTQHRSPQASTSTATVVVYINTNT